MENAAKVIEEYSKYYANNEVDKAISLIEDNKVIFDSATYHLFLGTALAKNGDLAKARLELEKAKYSGSIDNKIENNLDYITEKLNLVSVENSDSFFDSIKLNVSNLNFQWIIFIILLSSIVVTIFRHKLSRNVILMISVLSISLLITNKFILTEKTFCISQDEKKLYEGPSAIFTEINLLPQGLKYYIGENSGDYAFVEYPKNLNGWIKFDKRECINYHE